MANNRQNDEVDNEKCSLNNSQAGNPFKDKEISAIKGNKILSQSEFSLKYDELLDEMEANKRQEQ